MSTPIVPSTQTQALITAAGVAAGNESADVAQVAADQSAISTLQQQLVTAQQQLAADQQTEASDEVAAVTAFLSACQSLAADYSIPLPQTVPAIASPSKQASKPRKVKLHNYLRRRRPGFRPYSQVSYSPAQVAQMYGFPAGDGTGQTVGLIELGGGYSQADMTALGITNLVVVSVDGATNAPDGPNGAQGEVELDIQVVFGVAPKAAIRVYFAPNTNQGFVDAINQAVTDNVDVISISWGGPESAWSASDRASMDTAFQSAAAKQISVFVAAGDNGSTDGTSASAVDYPASSPYVTGCGGTNLTSISEVVWNDGNGEATGGGISSAYAKPSWQAVNVYGNGRGVPDVSGDADPETGYNILLDGKYEVIGGTSAVAPLWAGLTCLLNQALGKRLGALNPILYSLPSGSLKDITVGNNGAFSAEVGYDCCTGLGSPSPNLLTALQGSPTPVPPPAPTPVPTPTPTPTPVPTSTFKQQVDAVFAALEQQYARNRSALHSLQVAQQLVDQYLAQNPQAKSFKLPSSVVAILDAAFKTAEAAYPLYSLPLSLLQREVDHLLS